eukprot:gene17898-biopygen36413
MLQLLPAVANQSSAPSSAGTGSARGAFVTTCACHGCPWSALGLGGRSAYQVLGAWQRGQSGRYVYVDHRAPDGGGTLNSSTRMVTPEDGVYSCRDYP